MVREIISHIQGVEVFGIIALVLFSVFFALVVYWQSKFDKSFLKKMSNLPLDEDSINEKGETL